MSTVMGSRDREERSGRTPFCAPGKTGPPDGCRGGARKARSSGVTPHGTPKSARGGKGKEKHHGDRAPRAQCGNTFTLVHHHFAVLDLAVVRVSAKGEPARRAEPEPRECGTLHLSSRGYHEGEAVRSRYEVLIGKHLLPAVRPVTVPVEVYPYAQLAVYGRHDVDRGVPSPSQGRDEGDTVFVVAAVAVVSPPPALRARPVTAR